MKPMNLALIFAGKLHIACIYEHFECIHKDVICSSNHIRVCFVKIVRFMCFVIPQCDLLMQCVELSLESTLVWSEQVKME